MVYQDSRGNIQNEVFYRIDPEICSGSKSISLILSGSVGNSHPESESDYYIDADSIRDVTYQLQGVGIRKDFYRDTLETCTAVWIPIKDPNTGEVHTLKFDVESRSSYRDWIYLWNTSSTAYLSGSWVVGGIGKGEEEPYSDAGSSGTGKEELDYWCTVDPAGKSVLFVEYVPKNFEYAGEYNALLNNASSESTARFFTYSGSVKEKKYIADYHKIPAIGGINAGTLEIPGGLSDREAQTEAYLYAFKQSAVGGTMQTLDLAFMNFRAISASVYVDREEYDISSSIEEVWKDLQEGNTDDPETIYFIPRSELSESRVVLEGGKATIPVVGNILFKMDGNTPVRHVRATVYSPFINTVYRTDEFGVITELYSGSADS